MRARLCVEKPETIDYTVTITASAKEWEVIRDSLDKAPTNAYTAQEFIRFINDLLAQARKIYWANSESPK